MRFHILICGFLQSGREPGSKAVARVMLLKCGQAYPCRCFPICLYGFPYEDHAQHRRQVMLDLKREAARQGRTMSELVETALRVSLRPRRPQVELPPLPTFHGGGTLVDIADRDALYQTMEGR